MPPGSLTRHLFVLALLAAPASALADDSQDLAKKRANPTASLINLPVPTNAIVATLVTFGNQPVSLLSLTAHIEPLHVRLNRATTCSA